MAIFILVAGVDMPPTRKQIETMVADDGKSFNDLDLTGCDLSGLEFSTRDFKRAKLTGALLTGGKFDCCDFKRADLAGADLTGATFTSSPFHGARLDGATIKDATFEYCEFQGATWTDAVVKRCTFESCDDIVGLAPHKIYRSLSDMPEDAQKLDVCRARFAPLQALLGGAVQGTAEDTACALVGEFRGRAFRVDVDFYDGRPTLHLDTRETEDVWFYLYRDPKRRAKAEAAGAAEGQEDARLHFLSESVYLEEESQEELDACLAVLSRLRPETRQALIEAMKTFKLNQIEIADEHIEADYKKDILILELTQSVPPLLDLFAQLADAAEAGAGGSVTAPVTVSETVTGPVPVTGPVMAPGPETSSFELTKRCRHCGTVIPWGEFECPSCHKYF